jgi:gamma-glutamyltranspeptidase
MKKSIYKKIALCILTTNTLLIPGLVFANSTVAQTIHASSNSGGNTAQRGEEIVSHKTTSSVHITTVVNGKTVEDISETSSDGVHVESTLNITDDVIFSSTTLSKPNTVPRTTEVFFQPSSFRTERAIKQNSLCVIYYQLFNTTRICTPSHIF